MVRNYKRKTEDRWTKEDLLEALMSIKEKSIKINEASRQFGISRATLYRQYQKFIQAGGKCDVSQFRTCGGNPILTKVEEDVLEKTILDLRSQGFSVTSSDIKRICYEYCDSNSIPNQFNTEKRMASDDWYYGFLKRHANVRCGKMDGEPDENDKPSSTGRKRKNNKRGKRRGGKKIKVEEDEDDLDGEGEEEEGENDLHDSAEEGDEALVDGGSDEAQGDEEVPGDYEADGIEGGEEGGEGEAEDDDEGPPSSIGECDDTQIIDDDDDIKMPSLSAEIE